MYLLSHTRTAVKIFLSKFGIRCVWQCPCISEVLEALHEPKLRALEGCPVSSKIPSSVGGQGKEVAGRNGREQYSPQRGVIDLPSRQINYFLQKRKQKKIEFVARPAVSLVVVRGVVGTHHILGQVGEKSGQLSVAAVLTENKKHKRFYLTILNAILVSNSILKCWNMGNLKN